MDQVAPSRQRLATIATAWWHRACDPQHSNPGIAKRLQRCRTLADVIREPAALDLVVRLEAFGASRQQDALALARLLAHIQETGPAHPMRVVGYPHYQAFDAEDVATNKPILSTHRFDRLMRTARGSALDEGLRHLASRIKGPVSVGAFAEASWYWGDAMRLRWSGLYAAVPSAVRAEARTSVVVHTARASALSTDPHALVV